MAFVGREEQLEALREWWEEADARPALLWGRRRVGKTALLQEFAEGKRAVFHTGGEPCAPPRVGGALPPCRGQRAVFHP
ncbi:ATP-binding protein [Planomonospora algeriensis]